MDRPGQEALLRIRGGGARSATELCSLYDQDFVRSAYITLLGRRADPEGEQLFTSQLRAGVAKSQLLLALATSAEGRGKRIALCGLRKRLFFARFSRIPIVKFFFSFGTWEHSGSRSAQAFRRLENEVSRLVQAAEVRASLDGPIAEKLERLNLRVIELERARGGAAQSNHELVTVEQLLSEYE